ncbi:acid protease [Tricholoma matsutake]|nr:acid protease [Tricholoma matsutake 945]
MARTWIDKGKGKGKATARRASAPAPEGPGGADGIVLPLDISGSGVYDIAYTVKIRVGANNQEVSLQVDTGSSDLWIVSSACSSSLCGQTGGHTYDPSSSSTSVSTGFNFYIPYLQGSASGPIFWDRVELGSYEIDNQALAAANNITNEALSPTFDGILGLALPLNSIIASLIPPVTSNAADGAAFASNLFSITPSTSAPLPFLSLSLSRPGSSTIPSTLGIGRHPSSLIPDPSKIQYSTLVSESTGTLFWKVEVRAITVYVGGQMKPVQIGRSNTGAMYPSAVLDTGVPLILTTSEVANGIYGAIGINPGSDGQCAFLVRINVFDDINHLFTDYVPCTTPLNLTITLDNYPELPLHPLDLTAEPPKENNAAYCIGLIQSADSVLSQPNSATGDMILGVPFMRNVYTVMAYNVPNTNGTFPPPSAVNLTPQETAAAAAAAPIKPRLGLMSLTNPATALDEFHRVRVLNQPITSNNTTGAGKGSSGSGVGVGVGGKKISVGVIALIVVVGFFGLCFLGFVVRWWFFRRRYRSAGVGEGEKEGEKEGDKEGGGEYVLAKRGSNEEDSKLDVMKKMVFGEEGEDVTMSSAMTRVEGNVPGMGVEEIEMGYRRSRVDSGVDVDHSWRVDGASTLVDESHAHERRLSVAVPLLDDESMAGVGTAKRSGRLASGSGEWDWDWRGSVAETVT